MSRKKSILIVVAHADDMEFMAAGTVARFVSEKGYDVYEYILTDNVRGSYRLKGKQLIETSAKEALAAGEILGLKEVRFERYTDGDLNEIPPNVLREKIIRMIRELKADIVMSWDPFAPYEEHPDHRMVAMATLEAASFSGNPRFHPDQGHAPHPVTEAYWFAKSPWNAECVVDITQTMDIKLKALLAHDCQMCFTIDSMVQEAKVLGADVPLLGDAEITYQQLIEMGVRKWCAETGEAIGAEYAERFRYQTIGMLDSMLGGGIIERDFA